ncbi:MAG: histidine phosphatase family protein [Planktotalea sp.]|uniref:histidine phosphatase family protein n=1 Tax=Planktotalea sp. TaxID=2029877 RepID=UPI003C70B294
MQYPKVYLLRHGQTAWNLAARLQGRLDSKLTLEGHRQAERQGALLKDLWQVEPGMALYCSPQGRAQRTAQIATSGINAQILTDARIREISAGSWDGTLLEDIERTNTPLFEQARNAFELMFLAPDGEGEEAVLERCRSFLDDLKGPSVLITHGATLCVLRGLLRAMSFDQMLDLSHEQGCIYAIENAKEAILR